MKTLIIPVKKEKNVKIYNEGEFINIFSEFRTELNKLKPSEACENWLKITTSQILKFIEKDYNKTNGFLCNVGENLQICFVKIELIPPYHSVESVGKSILKNEIEILN